MSKRVDIRALECFITVAREGNVSRAARTLHITQPAVSLQLKRLGDETGLILFKRTRDGVALTPQGSTLLGKAEQVLNALSALQLTALRLTGEVRGKLKLGTIVDPEFTRLGQLLNKLLDTAPELDIELVHGMSGDIPDRLVKGDIDAGFYLGELTSRSGPGKKRVAKPRFLQKSLTHFRYRVVAPAGWERRVVGKDWSALAGLPWITTPPASVHHRLLEGVFDGRGVTPHSVALVDLEPSMLSMVKSGVGISLCRESIALHEKQVSGIVVVDDLMIETSLSFLVLAARKQDPKITYALDAIQRVWGAT